MEAVTREFPRKRQPAIGLTRLLDNTAEHLKFKVSPCWWVYGAVSEQPCAVHNVHNGMIGCHIQT